MNTTVLLLTLVGLGLLAYHNASGLFWGAGLALLLATVLHPGQEISPVTWGLAATSVLFAVVLLLPMLRRQLVSRPIMGLFRAAMPPLSTTEKEALEAGTVWWDGEIFSGQPNWERLLALPKPTLTAAEQAFLDGPVETLCHLLNDWEITSQEKDLPPQVWAYLKEQRFFGMIIPERYGGLGFSALAHSAVVLKVASRSVTAAVTVMVPNSLGPAELLLHYGTDAQKEHYLPRLADGRELPCFALTSPEAGSDAGSMPDRGVVCRGHFAGEDGVLGLRVTWNKRYITLGPRATVLGLAFNLSDPDHLLGPTTELGITLALIPTNLPGVIIGRRHNPLDIPFLNGPTQGNDLFIPLSMVIGGQPMVGRGWRMLMDCLAEGRSISLPALSAGAAKCACRVTGAYARVRRQFKLPIGRFEGVQEVLGRMAGQCYLMDAGRQFTVSAVDLGEKPSVISALTKYQLTERMRKVVNDAMDVVGGAGISLGPRNLLGRPYQSIPVGITVEGANILTRTLIVFGQGAVRAHPWVIKELRALELGDPEQALTAFDHAFFSHVRFVMASVARVFWYGLTGGRLAAAPRGMGEATRFYQQLTRMSAIFALFADVALLTLGGSLKRRESLSGRMADVLSSIYLATATLKRFHDQGQPDEEWPLLRWSLRQLLFEGRTGLEGFLANFPFRPLAWLLRLLAFPLGLPHPAPEDRLTQRAAELLLEPSNVRERLTVGIYVPPPGSGEALAELDEAFTLVGAAEALEKRIKQQGINLSTLTPDEQQLLLRVQELRHRVIQVDDFPATPLSKECVG